MIAAEKQRHNRTLVMRAHAYTLLILLLALPFAHSSSSYSELLEEDANSDMTVVEKNAAAFVRALEYRSGGEKMTRAQVQTVFADMVAKIRDEYLHHQQSRLKMIDYIRGWVPQVAALLEVRDGKHAGPLHDVLDTASEILGIEHEDGTHPHNQAKEIMIGIQKFTEAIVEYYNKRGYDHEDRKQEL